MSEYLTEAEREALAELALLYGTFLTGRWAEVMSDEQEPSDDWQEQAAREAVDLFGPGAREVLAAAKAGALREAARHFEYEMAEAWGRDLQWISTGSKVADLVASNLRDRAAEHELSPEPTPWEVGVAKQRGEGGVQENESDRGAREVEARGMFSRETEASKKPHDHAPGLWCDECPNADELRALVDRENYWRRTDPHNTAEKYRAKNDGGDGA